MKAFQIEPAIELYKDGFGEDLLGRKDLGDRLSALVDNRSDPLVISIDGDWGTGKTHFLKSWVGQHTTDAECKANLIYFDAFKADYLDAPLVSLVAAVSERLDNKPAARTAAIKRVAYTIAGSATRIGLAFATAGASEALTSIGLKEAVSDVLSAEVDVLSNEAQAAIDQFWAETQIKANLMSQFQAALIELTSGDEDSPTTPLVIVVDELDRCRPDYALNMLETVKHFFQVPNVHFVLGANLSALVGMVAVRYGPAAASQNYLGKFISLTLNLPNEAPVEHGSYTLAPLAYASALQGELGISQIFYDILQDMLIIISRTRQISLRDVGTISTMLSLLPNTAKRLDSSHKSVLVALVIARVIDRKFFEDARDGTLSPECPRKFFVQAPWHLEIPIPILKSQINGAHDLALADMYRSIRHIATSRECLWFLSMWQLITSDQKDDGLDLSPDHLDRTNPDKSLSALPKKLIDEYQIIFGSEYESHSTLTTALPRE